MNVLEQFKNRQKARKLRRQLTPEQRNYIDRISSDIWRETNDIGLAEKETRDLLNAKGPEMGFDPATILLLIQLAVAIYQALKHIGFLSPTAQQVTAIFETGEEYGMAD